MSTEKIEKIKDAIYESGVFDEAERSVILEKIEEWRHEDEAMSIIPAKLMQMSEKLGPILEEMGLL